MGLTSMLLDHDRCVYILTLGVVDGFRNQGIASQLIQLVTQHAQSMRCVLLSSKPHSCMLHRHATAAFKSCTLLDVPARPAMACHGVSL